MVHKVKDRPSAHITTGQQKAPELRAVITPLWSPFECICPPGFHSPPLRFQKMSWPWAADRRLTLKNTSMKYNTTPFPPTSSQSQGLRQLAAAQGDADTPDQREKEAHDPPGFLMPPHFKKKKKCDRSNFIHFFWFTKSKSESLYRKATERGEGPLGIETQTACVYGEEGVTHCLTKVSCDIKHGLRPVNTDLRPLSAPPLLPPLLPSFQIWNVDLAWIQNTFYRPELNVCTPDCIEMIQCRGQSNTKY